MALSIEWLVVTYGYHNDQTAIATIQGLQRPAYPGGQLASKATVIDFNPNGTSANDWLGPTGRVSWDDSPTNTSDFEWAFDYLIVSNWVDGVESNETLTNISREIRKNRPIGAGSAIAVKVSSEGVFPATWELSFCDVFGNPIKTKIGLDKTIAKINNV